MKAVTIAGGGLAGLTLGNLLAKAGVTTVLHEASTYPRHRVCGEFLCGDGAEILETAGLSDVLGGSVTHKTVSWFRHNKPVRSFTLPRPALGISRYLLDQRLAGAFAAAGGELRTRSRFTADPEQEGIVWCNGRRNSGQRWIGLKLHCMDSERPAGLELHLGRDGYAGASTVENGRENICGLFRERRDISAPRDRIFRAYLEASGLSQLAARLEPDRIDPASLSGVSRIRFSGTAPDDGAIRIGDQQSAIPPFTGNGMSVAIESAALAAPFIEDYAKGSASWTATRQAIAREMRGRLSRRLKIAGILHPFVAGNSGQSVLELLARSGLLPFNSLFSATH